MNKKLPPLRTELKAYTTEQLVDIIDKLINNYPDLESVSTAWTILLRNPQSSGSI